MWSRWRSTARPAASMLVSYVAVDDYGVLVNPMIASGQAHGAMAQGIGQALLEHAVYDAASGQPIAASLMDYALPRADDVPSFTLGFNGTRCTTNPLGVKGCGEAGAIAAFPRSATPSGRAGLARRHRLRRPGNAAAHLGSDAGGWERIQPLDRARRTTPVSRGASAEQRHLRLRSHCAGGKTPTLRPPVPPGCRSRAEMNQIHVLHGNPAWLPPLGADVRAAPVALDRVVPARGQLRSRRPAARGGVLQPHERFVAHARSSFLCRADRLRAGLAGALGAGAWSTGRARSIWRSARCGNTRRWSGHGIATPRSVLVAGRGLDRVRRGNGVSPAVRSS